MSTDDPPRAEVHPETGAAERLLAHLRADLTEARFTVDGVEALLGQAASAALRRDQTAPVRRIVDRNRSRLAVLVRLCTLGDACPVRDIERVFPRVGVAGLVELGLAVTDGRHVRMSVDLRPYADDRHDWWVVSDLGSIVTEQPLKPDHVLGIGPASATLASWTPRPRVEEALDIGTGCGVQALHLDSHATHIVATDVSRRALAMARLNASLAETRWDLRAGDLYAPVAGEQFDLVVSNPPFVISPDGDPGGRLVYRDGGRRADGFLEELVLGLADHLRPGGIATVIGNWPVRRGQHWSQRWGEWIGSTPAVARPPWAGDLHPKPTAAFAPRAAAGTAGVLGLDAWVICRDVVDTATYVETWLRDGGLSGDGRLWGEAYQRWLGEFERMDTDRVAFGVAVLQRPLVSRPTWADVELVEGAVDAPMGPHLLAGLRARTWLAESSDEDVFESRWLCADDVTVERHTRPLSSAGEVLCVRQGGGLRRHRIVDPVTVALLGVCDGDLTAGQALTAIAAVMGEDETRVRAQGLAMLTRLAADLMIVRGDSAAGR